jgi:multiple sugar transport system substrate-binding protein
MDERQLWEAALAGRLTRREVLRRAALLGLSYPAVSILLAACAPSSPGPVSPTPGTTGPEQSSAPGATTGGPADLTFMAWSYSVETVQDNVNKFMELNPTIKVTFQDFPWVTYHDAMVARFAGGNYPDLCYSADFFTEEWASAGWILPFDDHCPDLLKYQEDFTDYALKGMAYQGKLYGLPYYADLMTFFYNAEMAKQAGYDKDLETWDDVADMATAIKEKGLATFPVNIPLTKADTWTLEILYAMTYGEGGAMFDENNEPVFNKPGSEAERVLQWLHDAVHVWKIMDPAVLELVEADTVKSLAQGTSACTVLAKYNLAAANTNPGPTKGQFKLALMPGKSHATMGFSRSYAVTKGAAEKGPDAVAAACKFLDYFGGKTDDVYVVQKRWALELGLGFAVLPLYDDPEVAASINQWGDVGLEKDQATLAQTKQALTIWWNAWDPFAREQIQNAVSGAATPSEALKAMADQWAQLRAYYSG